MRSSMNILFFVLCCIVCLMPAVPASAALVANPQAFVDSKVEAYRKGLDVLEETYREKCTAGGIPLKKVVVGNPPEAGGGGGGGGAGGGGAGQGAGGLGDGGQGVGLGKPGGDYVIKKWDDGLPLVDFEVEQVTDSWTTTTSGQSGNPFTVDDVPKVFDVPGVDPRPVPGPLPPPRPTTNGICGPASGGIFESAPTNNLCSAGTSSAVSGDGPFVWTCAGINGGTTASCSANKTAPPAPSNGVCGSASGGTFESAPTNNLCAAGTQTAVSGYVTNWYWQCLGTNGGSNASCWANKPATPDPVNGVCGTANGGTFDSAPAVNLCSAGTQSAVTGTGPWNWTCTGINGGTTASCSANKTVTTPFKIESYPTTLTDTEPMWVVFTDTVQQASLSTISAAIYSEGRPYKNEITCTVDPSDSKRVNCVNAAPYWSSTTWEKGYIYKFSYSGVRNANGTRVQQEPYLIQITVNP